MFPETGRGKGGCWEGCGVLRKKGFRTPWAAGLEQAGPGPDADRGLWARMSQEITPGQSSFRKSLQGQKMPPFAGFSPKSVFVGLDAGRRDRSPPPRVIGPESSAQTIRLGVGNTCDVGRCDMPQAPPAEADRVPGACSATLTGTNGA